jgi:hypothetical protein
VSTTVHSSDTAAITQDTRLRVSPYERVASLIIAALILLGAAVLAMFIIVITMRAIGHQKAVPVTFIDEPYGRGDHDAGTARDAENSQVDELDEFFPPELDQNIQVMNDIISADLTTLETMDDQLANFGSNKGQGDSRAAGPLGEGDANVVPRWERWQVRFASADVESYAQQLDFFKIELAALGGGKSTVDYATNLSLARPTRRTGPSESEQRLYMTWRSGELIEADKQLLAKAGIDTANRVVLQFYPPETEAALAALEQQAAGTRDLKEIKRTVFGVKGTGGKYEFYVMSQEFRFVP